VFGPDKYHLRMSLSEALRDDVVALETGVWSLLPHPDLSGRPLVYFQPSRHTGKGYTAESLVSRDNSTIYPIMICYELTGNFHLTLIGALQVVSYGDIGARKP
jgi:hypothetical protein